MTLTLTSTFGVWLLGGVIALLIALLVVVRIARRMEPRGAAEPGPANPAAQPSAGAARSARMVFGALGVPMFAPGLTAPTRSRQQRIVVAITGVCVTAIVGLGFAAIREARSEPSPQELKVSEITAGELHGTYLSSGKHTPVVLIVPGSGPTDRDGNSPLGVKGNTYLMLAEALARHRISSVRVDKRGMFASIGAGDANAASVGLYTKDYHDWIDAIRKEAGVKCVWLLGHSEGALMVSAAAQGRKDVCGLILVSGMGRKMGDVIREQISSNPANAPVQDQAFAAIADLEAGRHPDTTNLHPALLPLFAPKVQDFLISVFAADPVEAVRKAGKKTLIIQGTTDLQVTLEDAKLLNAAPRTKLVMVEGMNHMLKEAPMDRAANIATYTDPALPIMQRVPDAIAKFIHDDDG
jgi:uncharacterized protein